MLTCGFVWAKPEWGQGLSSTALPGLTQPWNQRFWKWERKQISWKKSESFLLDTFGSTWRLTHRCTIFICYLGCEIDEIDDQHRNPNMNNKDHQVGQLTTWRPEAIFSILVDQVNLTTALGSWAFQIAKLPFTFVFICHRIGPTFQHLSSRFAHHHLPIELQLLR